MRIATCVICLACCCLLRLRADDGPAKPVMPPAAKRSVEFAKDIHPILTKHCLGCHNADKQRGGVRLDNRESALKGGNGGPVLKPGDGAHSRLLQVVAGLDPEVKMPPEGKPGLTS